MHPLRPFLYALALTPGLPLAQTPDAAAWRFQVTPYVWMAGSAGDMRPTAQAPTLHSRKSFSEILNHLDGAFFLHATARQQRFVALGDVTYASLSDAGKLPPGVSIRGKLRQTSISALAGYQLLHDHPRHNLDALGGVRFWHIRTSVTVPALQRRASGSADWVDPVIAVRLRSQLAPRWSSLLYADVGGFGVGARSTWQVMGSINYALKDNVHLSLGYRHLAVDYRKNGMLLNIQQGGPLLGATWQF
ncbi:hypothetical protein ACFO3A_09780 [Comamonas nitrativorans]|uniref:Outer membrane protein beta-barrel domain-containing protein n=1 Tax=Comamonas nitrativorans TaxID=108437 RepID=A0ABV9H0L1_9BURK